MTNHLHYPDLDRCRKLTEIGFPETEYVYIQKELMSDEFHIKQRCDYSQYEDEMYAKLVCPSVMEMLDVIPEFFGEGETTSMLQIDKLGEKRYQVCYFANARNIAIAGGQRDTLPNALADLILWLHENKYITFNK